MTNFLILITVSKMMETYNEYKFLKTIVLLKSGEEVTWVYF